MYIRTINPWGKEKKLIIYGIHIPMYIDKSITYVGM